MIRLSWCVAVRNRGSLYLSCVAAYCFFTYGIGNLTSILIYWQVIKCVAPVVCFRYYLGIYLFSVCKQVYRDAVWSYSILVVRIIPYLASAYFRYLRCMRILDGGSLF